MDAVTIEHRKQELRSLLSQLDAKPSHDWSRERQRIVVLQTMIKAVPDAKPVT